MKRTITRREALGIAAGVASAAILPTDWIFALNERGEIVRAPATQERTEWEPVFFTREQAEAVAALAEAIIPRTDTPGARDARVHEYIDLALSVADEGEQRAFVDGLDWMEKRSGEVNGKKIADASAAELTELLRSVSDEHERHSAALQPGTAFFGDIKTRTIFGYYTSREGWVEELGRPEAVTMETFHGCPHGGEHP